jgi:general secretion pathway protein C
MAAEATMIQLDSTGAARATTLALLLGLGAFLADRVIFFTTPAVAPPIPLAAAAPEKDYDRDRLLRTPLFGAPGAVTIASQVVNAPETRLALTLFGVFSGQGESSALIAAAGSSPRRYLQGATLPGGVVLAEVKGDHVLLQRQGQLETLRFPKGAASAGFQSTASGARGRDVSASSTPRNAVFNTTARSNSASRPRDQFAEAEQRARSGASANVRTPAFSPRVALRAFQAELSEKGNAALAGYGLAPASGGGGLEINNQVPAAALAQVGLRPGDRILTVNGQGVDGLAQNPDQIDAVLAAGSARLEIQRGERTFFVTAPLPE